MITEQDVNKAFEEEFDGVEKFLLVQEILRLREGRVKWGIVLNKLARLGNEPMLGNSDGNVIAQKALGYKS